MDQGTQEKVTDRFKFWPHYSVLCKGCKALHLIDQMFLNQVRFPNNDFSIVTIECLEGGSFYNYTPEELMQYPDRSITKTDQKVVEMEKRLGQLETKLDKIDRGLLELRTNMANKDDLRNLGKELKENFSDSLLMQSQM